jgi:hypothetical protein
MSGEVESISVPLEADIRDIVFSKVKTEEKSAMTVSKQ